MALTTGSPAARSPASTSRLISGSSVGAEGGACTAWLFYVAGDVLATMVEGVPVERVCLHPILDYPEFEVDLLGHLGPDDQCRTHGALA
jgi:hypothetical protein